MRRGALVAAGVFLVALGLYAVAGTWIAPRFVRDALIEQAALRGIDLRIERLRTNPFALAVELHGVEALANGRRVATAAAVRADLAWSSLWGDILVDRLVVNAGALELRGYRLEALELQASGLSSQPGETARYEAAGRLAAGGTLASRGRLTLEPLAASGQVSAAALALEVLAPIGGQLHGSAQYRFAEGRLSLEELALEAANPADGARANARGSMRFGPFETDLQIEAQGIGPAYARPWLPERLAAMLVSGLLSGEGRLRIGESARSYEGSLAVEGLRFDERDSGRLLFAWQRAETASAKLRFAPFGFEFGEVLAQAPEARLVIEPGGSVNFVEAFAGDGAGGGEPLRAAVSRLHVEEGVLHFADRSLETPFEATISSLAGTVTEFGTADDPAQVALSGRVEKYGSARIRGTINLGDPLEHADIRARLRNIDLAHLTPYVAKFAGYRVRSGTVSANLHYEVRDGQVVGRNDLLLQELQLGEKVEREGLKSLPLDLMVALLADDEGRIDLDIPVKGNLADPQFNFGGLLGRAIAGAVGKVVSAPFRALVALFGAEDGTQDEDLAHIRFPPGSPELPPPEAQGVARIAKALAERPRLGVAVHAAFDEERDAAALRRQAVRREILRRAGYHTMGPLEFSNARVLRAARALYGERIGDPQEREGKALVEELAQKAALEDDALHALARARAQAVQAALVQHGAQPQRIATAVKEGAPTELRLSADALSQDAVVQAAQRKLNAAGFEAGPVDGILGPKTRDALREYQDALHLEVSGVLDAQTLNALGLSPSAGAGASR